MEPLRGGMKELEARELSYESEKMSVNMKTLV